MLSEIINKNKRDSRLVGNIGKSILREKKISKKTIFVVEASSYQIEYSKIFKPNYAILLNISPDHLERHKTFKNYLNAKLKLFYSQKKNDFSFFNRKKILTLKGFKRVKIKSKIINVKDNLNYKDKQYIKNNYFNNRNNQQNLSFIFSICKKLKINKNYIFKVVNNFKGLKFRQEVIYNSKKLKIINDSKSTSFSSSINLLESLNNIFWILGGLPKKGDKLNLIKNKNIKKAYVYGNKKNFFIKNFKKKIIYQKFKDLKSAVEKTIFDIEMKNYNDKVNIIFSPCSASFDNFRNFEERGEFFNYLIRNKKIRI